MLHKRTDGERRVSGQIVTIPASWRLPSGRTTGSWSRAAMHPVSAWAGVAHRINAAAVTNPKTTRLTCRLIAHPPCGREETRPWLTRGHDPCRVEKRRGAVARKTGRAPEGTS